MSWEWHGTRRRRQHAYGDWRHVLGAVVWMSAWQSDRPEKPHAGGTNDGRGPSIHFTEVLCTYQASEFGKSDKIKKSRTQRGRILPHTRTARAHSLIPRLAVVFTTLITEH